MGIQTDSFVKQSILLNKLNVSIFFILMTTFMMNSIGLLLIPFVILLNSLKWATLEDVGINLTHE